jgi:hypothetical protein
MSINDLNRNKSATNPQQGRNNRKHARASWKGREPRTMAEPQSEFLTTDGHG